ncbi:hypothetical protein ACSVIJ_06080 [Pseudomonas sp. NCHU5208]|uniref:hypothetical protein n=1 Tax=unclassified Pseudomonas TaxID=196821 RepID=UPI003F9991B1
MTEMAFRPQSMDSAAVDGIGFWLGSAGALIQRIGLAVISFVFLSRDYRVYCDLSQRNKDLQGDKEGCATGVADKHDTYFA